MAFWIITLKNFSSMLINFSIEYLENLLFWKPILLVVYPTVFFFSWLWVVSLIFLGNLILVISIVRFDLVFIFAFDAWLLIFLFSILGLRVQISFLCMIFSRVFFFFLFKFVSKSVLHCGFIFYWILMIFEIQSGWVWIKLKEMSHSVWNNSFYFLTSSIFQPNLNELFFGPEG